MSSTFNFLNAQAAGTMEPKSAGHGSPSQRFLSPVSSASSFSVKSVPESYSRSWSQYGSGGSFALNSFASPTFKFSSRLLTTGEMENNYAAGSQLLGILKHYIIHRCAMNEFCCENDFDATALDALFKMPFLQAMQTVEHFSSSVSSRIQKKSAYLMGILRGQEDHWDKYMINTGRQFMARQVLDLPSQLLLYIGNCCLTAYCLPSDFNPEVVLSLHALDFSLAVKSVSAFNTNKRIIAGAKGGVINRPRFFLRLIQNVADQSRNERVVFTPERRQLARTQSEGSSKTSTSTIADHSESQSANLNNLEAELNLEQLAELSFEDKQKSDSRRLAELEEELRKRTLLERSLVQELQRTKTELSSLKNECFGLRRLLNIHQQR